MPSKPSPWFARPNCARSTAMFLAGLTALLLLPLAACSTVPSPPRMPALPANLAAPCPALSAPPLPLADPERSFWEEEIVTAYGDCAGRHAATVRAWPTEKKDRKP